MTQCSYNSRQQRIHSYLNCMEKSSATLSSSQLSSHTCLSCWSSSWAVQSVWGGRPYGEVVNNDRAYSYTYYLFVYIRYAYVYVVELIIRNTGNLTKEGKVVTEKTPHLTFCNKFFKVVIFVKQRLIGFRLFLFLSFAVGRHFTR